MSSQIQNLNLNLSRDSPLNKDSPNNKQSIHNQNKQAKNSGVSTPIGSPQSQTRSKSQSVGQNEVYQNSTPSKRQSQQLDEKQQNKIQKMLNQQQKGQNYKMGETYPICILKVRPLFIQETLISKKQMIEVLDRESLVFRSVEEEDESSKDYLMYLSKDKIYRANRMIPQDQSNSQLYGLEFPQIIDNLLKGISHAFLALGQKQSGKTHSLFGTLSDPGMILYFAQSLFATKHKSDSIIQIYFSAMKYNDDFQDMLCPTGEPLLFKQGKLGSTMPCLTRIKIESLSEFFIYFRLVLRSLINRDINKGVTSSQQYIDQLQRDHCIFRQDSFD